jgi:hypothetical protein
VVHFGNQNLVLFEAWRKRAIVLQGICHMALDIQTHWNLLDSLVDLEVSNVLFPVDLN